MKIPMDFERRLQRWSEGEDVDKEVFFKKKKKERNEKKKKNLKRAKTTRNQ